jgi:hypothetical protein
VSKQKVVCSRCATKQRIKRYHLEKFHKLCAALYYGKHLITNPVVKRNVLEALKACNWIYSED